MQIRSVRHKGLKRFVEDDDDRGIRSDLAGRVRNVVAAIVSAADVDGVREPLSGDRAGTWSVSVSDNWRITFRIENGDVADMDLEDRH